MQLHINHIYTVDGLPGGLKGNPAGWSKIYAPVTFLRGWRNTMTAGSKTQIERFIRVKLAHASNGHVTQYGDTVGKRRVGAEQT